MKKWMIAALVFETGTIFGLAIEPDQLATIEWKPVPAPTEVVARAIPVDPITPMPVPASGHPT